MTSSPPIKSLSVNNLFQGSSTCCSPLCMEMVHMSRTPLLCCTVINGVEASTKWTAAVGNNYRTTKEVTFHTIVITKYDKFMICIRSDQWCRFGDDIVGYIDSKHIIPSGCGRPSTWLAIQRWHKIKKNRNNCPVKQNGPIHLHVCWSFFWIVSVHRPSSIADHFS